MAAGIAAAVAPPAVDPVNTTPGGVFDDLDLVGRRVAFEELAVVSELRQAMGLDVVQRVSQRHVAKAVMVSVAFAVGGDVRELCVPPILRENTEQAVRQIFAARQQSLESHRAGDRTIIEEQCDLASRRQTLLVGARRIDTAAAEVMPCAVADAAHTSRLVRREDRKLDAHFGENFEGFQVHGGFGQPHAFGLALKAMLEVCNAPKDLGAPVACVGERHDHVIIGLRQRRAMSGKVFPAFAVRLQNRQVDVRCFGFQPREQGGAEIETDLGVVVHQPFDPALGVEDARHGIGRIALGGDALVPVVVGVGGILQLDGFEPGILPRRLIEMTMNADVTFHAVRVR